MNKEEIEKINNKTKIIGLTGGIGSGKSTVAKFIEDLGFPVYNSDYWAKELVNSDENLKVRIINLLGNQAYDENGIYNRAFVSSVVFENEEILNKLNEIIHPAVKIHFENWVKKQNSEFVFKETALLFELNLNDNCHKTILITADDSIRIKRVMNRDDKTYREVESVLKRQMSEKEKIKKADFIIENNLDLETLREQTIHLIENLCKKD